MTLDDQIQAWLTRQGVTSRNYQTGQVEDHAEVVLVWGAELGPQPTAEQLQAAYELHAPEVASSERMAKAKAARQVQVESIKVTTQAGHTFDGDEVSQGRMARAILALDAAGQTSTTWVLSNNTPTTVTRDDLQQALVLAGQEQTRLWLLPWEQA